MIAADIENLLSKHAGARRDALIPILQEVQEVRGYLSQDAIVQISRHLSLPASKVYGVATFYNQFRFRAPGKFHVQVCRGTACHVKRSARMLDATANALGINPGETTRDGLFSLEVVACLGACGLAPLLAVNGEFHAGVGPDAVKAILVSYRGKAAGDGRNR
jgi:NADH:ubiquinone oxidoreductase subunit E